MCGIVGILGSKPVATDLVDALRRHYRNQIQHKPEFAQWMHELGRSREVEMAA